MSFTQTAHRAAIRGEKFLERFIPVSDKAPVLEPYRGYATPDALIVRARVLTELRRSVPKPEQSKWANLRQMMSLFFTDEVGGVRVTADGASSLSDEEGYVTLAVPRRGAGPGWQEVPVRIEGGRDGAVQCPVMVPDHGARFGVISDIDDTMMETGAFSLARNLWTTFTGSALTRHVFPDSVAMMNALRTAARAPVYYVSSSPWNLHAFLEDVFQRAGLVTGPMFLRDLGISETQFVTGTHGDHKGQAIDTILASAPHLRFVLVGDTGQHDAEIYRAAIARHPGRIRAIVLRQPGPGPNADARAAMDGIRETGVPLFSDTSFDGFAEQVIALG